MSDEAGERRKLAVALRYVPGRDDVPLVLVNGQREIARAMVDLARRLRIPIVREPDLAGVLMNIPPGHPIPEELYEAVAVILATLFSREKGSP